MSTNEQGGSLTSPSASIPSQGGTTAIQNDIRSSFANNSPLQLLNLENAVPRTPPILDPQKVANDIAVQREISRIEAENLSKPTTEQQPLAPSSPLDPLASSATSDSNSLPKDSESSKDKSLDTMLELNEALDGVSPEDSKENLSDSLDKNDEQPSGEDEEEDPLAEIPDEPRAENFKKLKEVTRGFHKQLKEVRRDHAADRKRLEDYETGAVVPDVIREKDARIAELEPLEKIHNLKASPEYRQKYVEPLNHVGSRLMDLAGQYEVTEDAMKYALELRNVRQLDQFLLQQFGNTVGATQAKELISKAQGIQDQAYQAHAEPANALQRLKLEAEQANIQQETARVENIKQVVRDTWGKAIQAIREEGKAKELIPGDIDHNNRFVIPIQTAASREYGQLMVALAGAGIKEVPEPVAHVIARMTLMAHGSEVNRARAMAAEAHILELEKGAERSNYIDRPSLSGRNGTGSVSANGGPPKPATPAEMAQRQLADFGFTRR